MERPRAGPSRSLARSLALGTALALASIATAAAAAEAAPGAPAFKQARSAWDRGQLDTAEPLYREALERGGLAPAEVLEGYVRLGSIRAIRGKKDSAIAAFRAASILDANFNVPTEAGSKGASLADKAKRDTAKIGSIQLAIQTPKETPAGKAFKITATVDKAHIAIVNRIGVLARDGTTGKEITLDAKPDESVDFEVGSELTLPGASIVVRVDALDAHQNRLASAEERVRVPDPAAEKPVVVAKAGGTSGTGATTGDKPPAGDPAVRHGGSFWSSPWPYVIGGIALAGAGTAVYLGTRPAPSVAVGPVGVREGN